MDLNREADLHYAYQYGQDAARGNKDTIKAEFTEKFQGDLEAQIEFDKGFAAELTKLTHLN